MGNIINNFFEMRRLAKITAVGYFIVLISSIRQVSCMGHRQSQVRLVVLRL